jgi:hypothetical protein
VQDAALKQAPCPQILINQLRSGGRPNISAEVALVFPTPMKLIFVSRFEGLLGRGKERLRINKTSLHPFLHKPLNLNAGCGE